MSGGKPILTETEQYLADTWTSLPGEILSFDGIKADIRPLSKILLRDGSTVDFPYLTDILVITPSTKEYGIKFPIKEGDRGMLHFQDRDISNLLLNNESTPLTSRMHELTDAVFYLGFSAFEDAVASDDTVRIYYKDSLIQFQKDGTILIDAKETIIENDLIVNSGNLLIPNGDLIVSGISFLQHLHGGVFPGGSSTLPPTPPVE